MENVINTTEVHILNFMQGNKVGDYRAIVKVRAGFLTVQDVPYKKMNGNLNFLMNMWKKGALKGLEFKAEGSEYWFPIFTLAGKKVGIDEMIAREITVGTINCNFINTDLYGQRQYEAVGAKTWACKAYVMNQVEEVAI
jgi:hypothetical protein